MNWLQKRLAGNVSFLGRKIPKLVIAGVLAVVFMYVGVAGIISCTTPWWLGKGDAPRHIDYAWQIYNGNIPHFADKFSYPVFRQLGVNYTEQTAASNPPLFYVIQAPVVGPLLASGHWRAAIAAGRAFNIFIGVLCILALSWAGWLFGGKRKELFAVCVPAIAALMHQFTILNVNFALDGLLVLITTLNIIAIYKLFQYGPKLKYVIAIAVLAALGLATKVTYLLPLAVSMLSVAYGYYRQSNRRNAKQNLKKGLLVGAVVGLFSILAIGWFYYLWNYRTSGNFISATPPGYINIPHRGLLRVLTGNSLWELLYTNYSSILTVSVSLTAFSIAGLLYLFDRSNVRQFFKNKLYRDISTVMFLFFIAIFLTQVVHSDASGGYTFRYLLPVVLPISLLICYGLLEFKKIRGLLVMLFAFLLGGTTIYKSSNLDKPEYSFPSLADTAKSLLKIPGLLTKNNLPSALSYLLFSLFMAGIVIFCFVVYKLTALKGTNEKLAKKA